MTQAQWIILIAGLLGGGAMGAVITAVVTRHRNRRQPVGYKIEIIDILRKNPSDSLKWLVISVADPVAGFGHSVDSVSMARITILNKGNQDIEEFHFGATLEGTNRAIDLRLETPDRHHLAESLKPVALDNPTKELDFTLKPFNRGDEYIFNIYFVYDESPGPIKLSTPQSTKFVELVEASEMAKDAVVRVIKNAAANSMFNR